MATPKQTDPQFKLRLPLELKERIESAAQRNNRSMNAEIVARLEEYPSLYPLRPRVAQLTAELEAARDALAEQKKTTAMLQKLITESSEEASRDYEEREASNQLIAEKYNDLVEQRELLEALKEELMHLSEARGDSAGETARLLQQQAEMIEGLRQSQKLTEQTLLMFRDAFLGAESGDEAAFERLLQMFVDARKRSGHSQE